MILLQIVDEYGICAVPPAGAPGQRARVRPVSKTRGAPPSKPGIGITGCREAAKSLDVLREDVDDIEHFDDHAGTGLLERREKET